MLKRIVTWWQFGKDVRVLEQKSDRMLADIGIRRTEIRRLVRRAAAADEECVRMAPRPRRRGTLAARP